MTGILLIDSFKREISPHPMPGDNHAFRRLMGTDNLDHAVLFRTPDLMLCGFCDGDGYYKQPMAWSRLEFYPNPIPGLATLYCADEFGENTDIPPAIEAMIRDQIVWLDAQPQLPPITVNGQIVVDFNAPDRPKTLQETMQRLGFTSPTRNPK